MERNRIEVVLDKGIEEDGYNLAVNTVNALRTVGGRGRLHAQDEKRGADTGG